MSVLCVLLRKAACGASDARECGFRHMTVRCMPMIFLLRVRRTMKCESRALMTIYAEDREDERVIQVENIDEKGGQKGLRGYGMCIRGQFPHNLCALERLRTDRHEMLVMSEFRTRSISHRVERHTLLFIFKQAGQEFHPIG